MSQRTGETPTTSEPAAPTALATPAAPSVPSTRSRSRAKGKAPAPPPPSPPRGTSTAPDRHAASFKTSFSHNYKLSSIPKLTGIEDFQHWRNISQYVLELFNCWEIVLGTQTIDQYDAEQDDNAHANFQDRYYYAATYFIQTVDPSFLVILATQRAPDRIWTTLEDKFGRENTTSFFDQLNSVFDTK